MSIHDKLVPLDIAVLTVYILALIGLGIYVGIRRKGQDDPFLGGRSFGWFNVGLSIFGTNVSPSFLIASASAAYATGMVTANFEWLAWIFLFLLAMVFAPHYMNTRISTMPQFIRRRFGVKAGEFLSWYALLSTVVLWLGGTLYAGGLLVSQILGWDLLPSIVFLAFIATFLTVVGGLAVVIVTDTFQSILMICGTSLMALIAFYHVGGIGNLLDAVPPEQWTLFRPGDDPDYPWYAILLGYPVLGIWFWCTDQTIVQRVLGARDIQQGQFGALFAGGLKVLTPFIFTLPGIFCFVLHPELESADEAFSTLVVNYLPAGLTGLIVAVLVAALISTVDSGLNSFSTIFTMDIYARKIKKDASPHHLNRVSQIVTVSIAIISVGIALSLQSSSKNLFDLLQSIIAYFAPPMAAVFLVGILWPRATSIAAMWTLSLGSMISLSVGWMDFNDYPNAEFWPHFLFLSFLLFLGISVFMILISLVTKNHPEEEKIPNPVSTLRGSSYNMTRILTGWAILAVVMIGIYILFN